MSSSTCYMLRANVTGTKVRLAIKYKDVINFKIPFFFIVVVIAAGTIVHLNPQTHKHKAAYLYHVTMLTPFSGWWCTRWAMDEMLCEPSLADSKIYTYPRSWAKKKRKKGENTIPGQLFLPVIYLIWIWLCSFVNVFTTLIVLVPLILLNLMKLISAEKKKVWFQDLKSLNTSGTLTPKHNFAVNAEYCRLGWTWHDN